MKGQMKWKVAEGGTHAGNHERANSLLSSTPNPLPSNNPTPPSLSPHHPSSDRASEQGEEQNRGRRGRMQITSTVPWPPGAARDEAVDRTDVLQGTDVRTCVGGRAREVACYRTQCGRAQVGTETYRTRLTYTRVSYPYPHPAPGRPRLAPHCPAPRSTHFQPVQAACSKSPPAIFSP